MSILTSLLKIVQQTRPYQEMSRGTMKYTGTLRVLMTTMVSPGISSSSLVFHLVANIHFGYVQLTDLVLVRIVLLVS